MLDCKRHGSLRWKVIVLAFGITICGSGVEGARSPLTEVLFTAQQELPVITVCPEGPPVCQFSKIQDAINAAPVRALILIEPGTYVESLKISKNLTLWGTGPGVSLYLPTDPGPGTVIDIRPPGEEDSRFPKVTLANLSIRTTKELAFGVSIENAFVTLQNLDIASQPGQEMGIGVAADKGAVLVAVNSRIAALIGVSADRAKSVTLSQVIIERPLVGVQAFPMRGGLLISKTQIREARSTGIWLAAASSAFIVDSQIKGGTNASGITALGSNVVIRSTQIEGLGTGVGALDNVTLTMLGNTISRNEVGVLLGNHVRALLTQNRIAENQGWGVALKLKACLPESDEDQLSYAEVLGWDNEIPDKEEAGANRQGDVCPAELKFLKTPQGGRYP